jgi:uncharacterized membrane protein HdeD (DUF308 family)
MTASAQAAPASDDLPWWLGIVQGVTLLVLGVLCLTAPGATLFVIVQLTGIYFLVTGILGLISLVSDRGMWLWKVFAGIVGILAGIAIIQHPLWSTVLVPSTLILVVGIFGIVSGIVGMVHSLGDRSWAGILLGLFGVLLGLVLVANPVIGAVTLPFVVGVFATIGGVMAIVASLADRRRGRRGAAASAPDLALPVATGPDAAAPASAAPAPAAGGEPPAGSEPSDPGAAPASGA